MEFSSSSSSYCIFLNVVEFSLPPVIRNSSWRAFNLFIFAVVSSICFWTSLYSVVWIFTSLRESIFERRESIFFAVLTIRFPSADNCTFAAFASIFVFIRMLPSYCAMIPPYNTSSSNAWNVSSSSCCSSVRCGLSTTISLFLFRNSRSALSSFLQLFNFCRIPMI